MFTFAVSVVCLGLGCGTVSVVCLGLGVAQ